MEKTSGNLLKQFDLFQSVSHETLEALWRMGRVRICSAKTILFRAKEHCDFVFILLSGKCMLYNISRSGQQKIIFIFGKGQLLNDAILPDTTALLYCETLERCAVFVVPSSAFLTLMSRDFSLTQVMLSVYETKIRRLEHQLKNTVGSVYMERKLSAKLWKLARDFGIPHQDGIEIDLDLTITFLSNFLGAPRETTSRLCKSLVDKGLIKMNKKRIIVTNPDELSQHFYREQKKNKN